MANASGLNPSVLMGRVAARSGWLRCRHGDSLPGRVHDHHVCPICAAPHNKRHPVCLAFRYDRLIRQAKPLSCLEREVNRLPAIDFRTERVAQIVVATGGAQAAIACGRLIRQLKFSRLDFVSDLRASNGITKLESTVHDWNERVPIATHVEPTVIRLVRDAY